MDALLLHAFLPELATLAGSRIRSVDQADPRTVLLGLDHSDGTRYLVLSCDLDFPRIEILTEPPQSIAAQSFAKTLRVYLAGATLDEVRQVGFDRVVALGFTRKRSFSAAEQLTLMLRLFGRRSNMFLETADGTLASLKPGPIPRRPAGTDEKQNVRCDPLSDSQESLKEALASTTGENLRTQLVSRFTGISPLWADEILFRADLDPETSPAGIKPWQVDLLWSHLIAWIEEVRSGDFQPCIYNDPSSDPPEPMVVTPFPIQHLKNTSRRQFGGVTEAVSAFYGEVVPNARDRGLREAIGRQFRTELKRIRRTLNRVAERKHNASREGEFRRFGELILSNLHAIKSSGDEVSVVDHYDPERPHIRIPVDPAKTPRVNAELYFTKARKAQRSKRALADEESRLLDREKKLEREIEKLGTLSGESLFARARDAGVISTQEDRDRVAKETTVPFRIFQTTSGWTVWVGRNDRQNDLLTHSYASAHDYWFHAVGMAGSHVVLRRPDKRQRPSRRTIHEVARIAAYYSKGRRSKSVDVTYTEKKYVRKPRRGRPGLALVTNEEVVFVEPQLPDDSKRQHGRGT